MKILNVWAGSKSKPFFFQALLWIVIFAVFVLPVIRFVYTSFTTQDGLSLSNFVHIFHEASTWVTLERTLWIVLCATLLSSVLGIAFAVMIAYTDIRGKQQLHVLILLSYIIPSYILTLAWTEFFAASGPVAQLLHSVFPDAEPWNVYSYGGIMFVMGLHYYPLVYLFTVSALRKIPIDLELAGRISGSGKFMTFVKITLPLALPGVAGGALLTFLSCLDNFGIPAFLGIPANITVLSTLIYQQIAGIGPSAFPRAAAISVLLGLIALIGIWLQWRTVWLSKVNETVLESREPRVFLGRYRLLTEIFVWAILLIITFVPMTSMVMSSLKRAYGLPFGLGNITWSSYQGLLENPKTLHAIVNSIKFGLITTFVCLIVGTIFAYYRIRSKLRLWRWVELMISLPFALPGIVCALAMIVSWMEPLPGWNAGIYGSAGILYIAYITRFLIIQMRSSSAAMLQLDPAVEEASQVFGAGGFKKWRYIVLPLIRSGMLNGSLLVLLTTMTELTMSSLLWSSGSETIGVVIFNYEQAGDTNYSSALSTLILVLIYVGLLAQFAWKKLNQRKEAQ